MTTYNKKYYTIKNNNVAEIDLNNNDIYNVTTFYIPEFNKQELHIQYKNNTEENYNINDLFTTREEAERRLKELRGE